MNRALIATIAMVAIMVGGLVVNTPFAVGR